MLEHFATLNFSLLAPEDEFVMSVGQQWAGQNALVYSATHPKVAAYLAFAANVRGCARSVSELIDTEYYVAGRYVPATSPDFSCLSMYGIVFLLRSLGQNYEFITTKLRVCTHL